MLLLKPTSKNDTWRVRCRERQKAIAAERGLTLSHGSIRILKRQRLRLGVLGPELLDAYRNGDISLDVVTAFTLGADHQAQLAVWHQVKDQPHIQPYTVRRLLTQTEIRSTPISAGLSAAPRTRPPAIVEPRSARRGIVSHHRGPKGRRSLR